MKTFLFTLLFCSNVNAEASAGQGFESFKKNVYPLVVEQCSRCHSDAGPGPNHSSADALTSYKKVLGYTDFSDIKNSKFVLKGINNHYDGYLKDTDKKPTITQEELVTAFQKWWNEGENKSFFEGKKVLSEKQIPSLKDDGSFETLSWDLGDLDPKLKGAQFSVSIQKFSGAKGTKGAYRLKNPSIKSHGLMIDVKALHIIVNGVADTRAANFSKISETLSSALPKTLIDAHQIVLEDKGLSDKIGFAFEILQPSTQPPSMPEETKSSQPQQPEIPNIPIFDESKYGKAGHFVKIKAPVEFEMGTPLNSRERFGNEVVRRIRLTQSFEMQATPVTQFQWLTIMNQTPANNRQNCDKGNEMKVPSLDSTICKNHPVESIVYSEVDSFIKKINSMQIKYTYRLPTEAEWEFVARAGMPVDYRFPWGNEFDSSYAWCDPEAGSVSHEVGTKKPTLSPDGDDFVYDMMGNVLQFATLSFSPGEDSDNGSTHFDPEMRNAKNISARGHSYYATPFFSRVSNRTTFPTDQTFHSAIGFRLVRTKR